MAETSRSVTLLGSGGWIATHRRQTAAIQIHESVPIIFDAGTGMGSLLDQPSTDELHVVLTHFHLDHIVGLSYLPGLNRETRITVHAPGQLLLGQSSTPLLETLLGSPYLSVRLKQFVADIRELRVGSNDVGGVEVLARKQDLHSGGSMALRVGAVTYCTDTEPDPGNVGFAAESRILLHEAWHPTQSGSGHSGAVEVAELAREAGVGTLILCHLNPRERDEEVLSAASTILDDVILGQDDVSL